MKTFTYYKCKSIAKKIGVLGLAAFLVTSCGSKDSNTTNTSAPGTPIGTVPGGTSPLFGDPSAGGSSSNLSSWETLKGQTPCGSSSRMSDMTFTLSGQTDGYRYYLNQGNPVSGTPAGSYFGRSDRGDLLFISKVTGGNGQLQYNFAVSFCTSQYNGIQFIGPNAGMSQYYAAAIRLTEKTNCASGDISQGTIGFFSQNFGEVPIAFAPVSLGQQCL